MDVIVKIYRCDLVALIEQTYKIDLYLSGGTIVRNALNTIVGRNDEIIATVQWAAEE